jgi:hypothetical protein
MTISSTVILQISEDSMLNTEISLKSFWNPKRASSSTISKTAFYEIAKYVVNRCNSLVFHK